MLFTAFNNYNKWSTHVPLLYYQVLLTQVYWNNTAVDGLVLSGPWGYQLREDHLRKNEKHTLNSLSMSLWVILVYSVISALLSETLGMWQRFHFGCLQYFFKVVRLFIFLHVWRCYFFKLTITGYMKRKKKDISSNSTNGLASNL